MIKKINQYPTIADTILFELETPGLNGLLKADPTTIEHIAIYYIERDFSKLNDKSYEAKYYSPELEASVERARELVHNDPSPKNIENLTIEKIRLEAAALKHDLFFNETKPVYTLGSKDEPAWVAEDPMRSMVKAVVQNDQGHEQFGRFRFEWDAAGNKEGDYFINWSWRVEDRLMYSHQTFHLDALPGKNTYIEMRYTQDKKYETLLDRYTPTTFKYKITNTDLTPHVLGRFHRCVARGFTQLEDLANHLIDVYDANTTHEAILPLLGNMFNLKLKSNDVTLWRRQIKQAIPLFKRKGTIGALTEALDQAGIKLTKLTKLWQVVSEYNWTDAFVNDGTNSVVGKLSKVPYDMNTVQVSIRAVDSEEFLNLPKDCVKIRQLEKQDHTVLWFGDLLKTPIQLYEGDLVLIKYQIKPIPPEREALEKYIQTLPLADVRDPTAQKWPRKNWNVRLIEEDDPLIDSIIKSRHPFYDPVTYGKVRTTFLYSEKVYNMDTYNGSLRDSKTPCDIDKEFMDGCSYCQSSHFNVDLEIENLSSDRVEEAKEIIKEYAPFHAILNAINISGVINEFVVSPVESIETLVNVRHQDTVGSKVVKDTVVQKEEIEYQIEWADGSKESQKLGEI